MYVFYVHGSAETLSVEKRVFPQEPGHATAAEYVGEVKLAAGFEDTRDFREDVAFGRGEVDDTVRDYDVG